MLYDWQANLNPSYSNKKSESQLMEKFGEKRHHNVPISSLTKKKWADKLLNTIEPQNFKLYADGFSGKKLMLQFIQENSRRNKRLL